jgi:hypothetical protein
MRQDWAGESTPDTTEFLQMLLSPELVLETAGDGSAILASLLEVAEKQDWYADGVTVHDLLRLRAAYDSLYLARSDGTEFAEKVARAAITSQPTTVVLPSGEASIVFVSDNPSSVTSATGLFRAHMPAVDEYFAGTATKSIVVAIADRPDQGTCQASPFNSAILLDTRCLDQGPVLHELTHMYVIANAPTWFNEGIAVFLAGTFSEVGGEERYRVLRSGLTEKADLQFHLEYRGPEQGEYLYERTAGAVFLYDAQRILGHEGLRAVVHQLNGPWALRGHEVLDALVKAASTEQGSAIEQLIDERVTR